MAMLWRSMSCFVILVFFPSSEGPVVAGRNCLEIFNITTRNLFMLLQNPDPADPIETHGDGWEDCEAARDLADNQI